MAPFGHWQKAFVTVAYKQLGSRSPQRAAKHVTFLENNDSIHKWSLGAPQWHCLFRQVMSSKQKPLHKALPRTSVGIERPLGDSSDLIGREKQSGCNIKAHDANIA